MKKPTKASLRKKADTLLQEYIRGKYKYCLVCSNPVWCGHHFITKKNSNALRYYIPNIIPICFTCHSKVHTQPHLVEPRICFLMGSDWYDDLIREKQNYVKANLCWYKEKVDEMSELLNSLNPAQH